MHRHSGPRHSKDVPQLTWNRTSDFISPRWRRPAQVLSDAVTTTTLTPLALCWFRALKTKSSYKVCLVLVHSSNFLLPYLFVWLLGGRKEHKKRVIYLFIFYQVSDKLSRHVIATALPITFPQFDDSTKPACFYRFAADPPSLPKGRVCASCPQLYSLQRRGRIRLQGQRLLVQMWPQVPTVQLPIHGHPSHGREPGEDHRDMGGALQRLWRVRYKVMRKIIHILLFVLHSSLRSRNYF